MGLGPRRRASRAPSQNRKPPTVWGTASKTLCMKSAHLKQKVPPNLTILVSLAITAPRPRWEVGKCPCRSPRGPIEQGLTRGSELGANSFHLLPQLIRGGGAAGRTQGHSPPRGPVAACQRAGRGPSHWALQLGGEGSPMCPQEGRSSSSRADTQGQGPGGVLPQAPSPVGEGRRARPRAGQSPPPRRPPSCPEVLRRGPGPARLLHGKGSPHARRFQV